MASQLQEMAKQEYELPVIGAILERLNASQATERNSRTAWATTMGKSTRLQPDKPEPLR
jgi:hypothetical protein